MDVLRKYELYPARPSLVNHEWLGARSALAWAMDSLAARAMMSAQDTLYWHCGSLSTAALALRTVWNPSRFSDWLSLCRHSSSPFEFTIMIDASQPCTRAHQINHHYQTVELMDQWIFHLWMQPAV